MRVTNEEKGKCRVGGSKIGGWRGAVVGEVEWFGTCLVIFVFAVNV